MTPFIILKRENSPRASEKVPSSRNGMAPYSPLLEMTKFNKVLSACIFKFCLALATSHAWSAQKGVREEEGGVLEFYKRAVFDLFV